MPQAQTISVENNFTRGLITESTGLNFPENAATDTDNCEFTLVGDTLRREGFDLEIGYTTNTVDRTLRAISSYKWDNAGGNSLTQVVVEQIGETLYFYKSSNSTSLLPVSRQLLSSTVALSTFAAADGSFDYSKECEYASGNGYLFVYHPNCDPLYCTYVGDVITANPITINTRDFVGIIDGLGDNVRPNTLSAEHSYNILNQGWILGNSWSTTSSTPNLFSIGVKTFTVAAGLTITAGLSIFASSPYDGLPGTGTLGCAVISYSGTTLTVNAYALGGGTFSGFTGSNWTIVPSNTGLVDTWHTSQNNYPSNSDVWWYFKDTTNVFNPTATINNISIGSSKAPRGHFILNEFSKTRSVISGVLGLTNTTTISRPSTGCWFQGRVWYTGVDASSPAVGDAQAYSWTENIYFSQIVNDPTNFGQCLQLNDPTSEQLFDLLPTDGGVIRIQESGKIYKLFPYQNGLLVFASNGIWFITGSQGIGFSANDYTITKISSIQSISGTSFVNVNGIPYFWNEEGIYNVQPSKQGGITVEPITVGTILSFYNKIPTVSKRYARGAYHPIDYNIQWVYKDTSETNVTDRYTFNKILNFNTFNKAFFPYTVDTTKASINSILYLNYPSSGGNTPNPSFKYFSSYSSNLSFADQHDTSLVDWASRGGTNYVSYFVTGYKLRGKAIVKFQPVYIRMYLRTNGAASSYKIQGIWDYANSRSSGKWSSVQLVTNALTRFDTVSRRHKIRGNGYALQFKISSVDGMPFDVQGWAVVDAVNQGV